MKTAFLTLLLFILALVVLGLAGCSTVTVRTITTDKGGTVTDVTSTTRGTDPAALQLAGSLASVYLPPRARRIREDKSGRAHPEELQRILRGRPITRQEIAARWKPSPQLTPSR